MANFFKNKVITDIGTTPIEVLATTPSTRATVIGLSLTNLTSGNILGTITITDDANVTGHYVKDVVIPPNSSLRVVNGGEKLIIAPSNSISVYCSQADALDMIMSYVEIA
jgi:hypothetical protein